MKHQNSPDDLIALWRYGLISPLLHGDIDGLTLQDRLNLIAAQKWVKPGQTPAKVEAETLRKWLYRYRASGLAGLRDAVRRDKGSFQIADSLQDAIRQRREQHPRWTLSILFEDLLKAKLWNGIKPSRAALYRFCEAHHLQRDPHRQPSQTFQAFEHPCFGQLWMFDFMHGPKVWFRQQKRKAYLHAILDDCTRYIVAGQFHFAETVESMLEDLQAAIRRFGIPQRLYSDNGAAYKSTHLKMVGARLAMALPHTPPYRPEGRGKIERFFRTVQERFLATSTGKTLEALNQEFQGWLNEYHQSPHSMLGESPLARRSTVNNLCQRLPEQIALDPLFYFEKRCRVYQHGVIRLRRRDFEVPGCLSGSRVKVFYLPWKPEQVWYGDEYQPARLLDKHANARRGGLPGSLARKEATHGQE